MPTERIDVEITDAHGTGRKMKARSIKLHGRSGVIDVRAGEPSYFTALERCVIELLEEDSSVRFEIVSGSASIRDGVFTVVCESATELPASSETLASAAPPE